MSETFHYGPSVTFAVRVTGDTWKCFACSRTAVFPEICGYWGLLPTEVQRMRDHFLLEHGTEADAARVDVRVAEDGSLYP